VATDEDNYEMSLSYIAAAAAAADDDEDEEDNSDDDQWRIQRAGEGAMFPPSRHKDGHDYGHNADCRNIEMS